MIRVAAGRRYDSADKATKQIENIRLHFPHLTVVSDVRPAPLPAPQAPTGFAAKGVRPRHLAIHVVPHEPGDAANWCGAVRAAIADKHISAQERDGLIDLLVQRPANPPDDEMAQVAETWSAGQAALLGG
ncbi:hypothetical protein MMC34_008499 [Xylographa carneopallida]|nr:hypothetical protein [Xylographa carneopallida]